MERYWNSLSGTRVTVWWTGSLVLCCLGGRQAHQSHVYVCVHGCALMYVYARVGGPGRDRSVPFPERIQWGFSGMGQAGDTVEKQLWEAESLALSWTPVWLQGSCVTSLVLCCLTWKMREWNKMARESLPALTVRDSKLEDFQLIFLWPSSWIPKSFLRIKILLLMPTPLSWGRCWAALTYNLIPYDLWQKGASQAFSIHAKSL